MKIEIAESLIYSYLKHVEGCRIVQTNWTTSGKWTVTNYDIERARELFNKVSSSEHFVGIFKNNSFEQLIKQAEIDILGINTAEETIYGIDIAFHSAGLNYGSKTETALRIVKKIFRTIFIMQSYFNENEKYNSYFITPKVNRATKLIIEDLMRKAKEVINDDNITIDFISNELFYSDILDSLLENIEEEHDSTELFLRAFKLMKLDNRKSESTEEIPKYTVSRISSKKREVSGMKIGQFVQHSFRKAFELNLLTISEINELQKPEYSKRIFNSNYEILKNKNRPIKDEYGRTRYYSRENFCENYHLTSQWFEPQWESLLDWLKKIGYNYKNNAP
jgi:hypothetical protein